MDTATHTLADIVTANPATARVFERFGLDYCCHGGDSIDAACAAAGIDPADVQAELDVLATADPADWANLDPTELADHIVETHHRYLHEELPLLDALAAKVASVHGERHPELAEVYRLVVAVRNDLEPHLMREERILFPAIHAMAAGQREFPFGTVANPIRIMTSEHEQAGELLAELRATTGSYAVPEDACGSYHSLYERLEALEADTHLHVHKENHLLFPAAIALSEV